MYKPGENIYTNFAMQSSDSRQNSAVDVILFGNSGVGKTSLLNHLCATSHPVGISKETLTTELTHEKCAYPSDGSFCICDSPGLQMTNLKNVQILYDAMAQKEWNAVVVVTQLHSRYQDITLTNLRKLSRMFKKQSARMVFVVTNLDMVHKNGQQLDTFLAGFVEALERKKFTEKVILMSNSDCDQVELQKVLYNTVKKMRRGHFQINQKKWQIEQNQNFQQNRFHQQGQYLKPKTQIIEDKLPQNDNASRQASNSTQPSQIIEQNLPQNYIYGQTDKATRTSQQSQKPEQNIIDNQNIIKEKSFKLKSIINVKLIIFLIFLLMMIIFVNIQNENQKPSFKNSLKSKQKMKNIQREAQKYSKQKSCRLKQKQSSPFINKIKNRNANVQVQELEQKFRQKVKNNPVKSNQKNYGQI